MYCINKLIECSSEKVNRTFLNKSNVIVNIAYCFSLSVLFKNALLIIELQVFDLNSLKW
jgi:hypothetical protein